jgi:uncharacterized phage-like protein YoqJ
MVAVCCFTGHRPEKLKTSEAQIKTGLQKEIRLALADGYTSFVSGMARGVDLWAAQLVLDLKKENPNLQLLCAVPYAGFAKKWPTEWQRQFHAVLAAADDVKVFHPSFSYASFQERNRWMVDHSARIIAVYHGERGETYNTIRYAEQRHVQVRMISG